MQLDSRNDKNTKELLEKYTNDKNLQRIPTLLEQEHYESRMSNLKDKSKIIDTWTNIQSKNVALRSKYANLLFWLLFFQLAVVDLIIILVGASKLVLSNALIAATIIKALLEVIGFIYIIVNYLFKPIDSEIDKLLEKLS